MNKDTNLPYSIHTLFSELHKQYKNNKKFRYTSKSPSNTIPLKIEQNKCHENAKTMLRILKEHDTNFLPRQAKVHVIRNECNTSNKNTIRSNNATHRDPETGYAKWGDYHAFIEYMGYIYDPDFDSDKPVTMAHYFSSMFADVLTGHNISDEERNTYTVQSYAGDDYLNGKMGKYELNKSGENFFKFYNKIINTNKVNVPNIPIQERERPVAYVKGDLSACVWLNGTILIDTDGEAFSGVMAYPGGNAEVTNGKITEWWGNKPSFL